MSTLKKNLTIGAILAGVIIIVMLTITVKDLMEQGVLKDTRNDALETFILNNIEISDTELNNVLNGSNTDLDGANQDVEGKYLTKLPALVGTPEYAAEMEAIYKRTHDDGALEFADDEQMKRVADRITQELEEIKADREEAVL